jgi:hypothetical protein
VLAAHGIAAPISRDTAHRWMKKGGAHTMGSGKSYYNDHHENHETIAARRAFDKEMSGPANCSSASPPSAPPRTARRCGLTSDVLRVRAWQGPCDFALARWQTS